MRFGRKCLYVLCNLAGVCVVFRDRLSCGPGWFQTSYVAKNNLERLILLTQPELKAQKFYPPIFYLLVFIYLRQGVPLAMAGLTLEIAFLLRFPVLG